MVRRGWTASGRAVAGLACAGLVLALPACSGGDGLDTDKLVIYSGRQEQLVAPLLERFEQDTGIEVSVRYGDTAQLAAQLIEEGDRTAADIFFSQDGGVVGTQPERCRVSSPACRRQLRQPFA